MDELRGIDGVLAVIARIVMAAGHIHGPGVHVGVQLRRLAD